MHLQIEPMMSEDNQRKILAQQTWRRYEECRYLGQLLTEAYAPEASNKDTSTEPTHESTSMTESNTNQYVSRSPEHIASARAKLKAVLDR